MNRKCCLNWEKNNFFDHLINDLNYNFCVHLKHKDKTINTILKGKAELNLYAKKKELFHKRNWALLSKKV